MKPKIKRRGKNNGQSRILEHIASKALGNSRHSLILSQIYKNHILKTYYSVSIT